MLHNMRLDNERSVWRDVVVWILGVTLQSPRTRNVTGIYIWQSHYLQNFIIIWFFLPCNPRMWTLRNETPLRVRRIPCTVGSSAIIEIIEVIRRRYSQLDQSQLLRLILGRIKCGVTRWWGGEPVFNVRFDFYSSHDILRMFEQDLEYEKSNWKYIEVSIKGMLTVIIWRKYPESYLHCFYCSVGEVA